MFSGLCFCRLSTCSHDICRFICTYTLPVWKTLFSWSCLPPLLKNCPISLLPYGFLNLKEVDVIYRFDLGLSIQKSPFICSLNSLYTIFWKFSLLSSSRCITHSRSTQIHLLFFVKPIESHYYCLHLLCGQCVRPTTVHALKPYTRKRAKLTLNQLI